MPDPVIELLLSQVDEAFEKKAWHGSNLRGSIRGLDPRIAAWHPGPNRHSIQEQVLHAAYWKYAVRRRLAGEEKGSFPLEGSNWFPRPDEPDAALWKKDVALLAETHRTLRAAIAMLSAKRLGDLAPGGKTTIGAMVSGIAMHDVYHTGQIQLLKRLYADAMG